MENNKDLFESMPVPKALATLAIPTIISQLIAMIYNLADTFFIGQTNNFLMIDASTVGFTLIFITSALSNLFGIGGSSLVSRLLGLKKPEEAKKVSACSFYGTIIVSLIYGLICLIFMEPVLYFFGAAESFLEYAKQYTLWVIVIGAVPMSLSTTMAHLLRSEGFAKKASFGLGMGGVLNIALDPLFMFVLLPKGDEVLGAAVATMIANAVSAVYFLIIFIKIRKTTVLTISPKKAIEGTKYIGEIFSVGLPSALTTLLACASNIVINRLAVAHSEVALASFGIVKKIDMLPMNVGMGLCQGMMPLVAYNYAAKNYQRMKSFTNWARTFGIIFAGICIITFEILSKDIVKLFINEPETVALGTDFLRICCLSTPLMICNFQIAYSFQAMGMGKQSMLLACCRQGIFNIPLLFLMDYLFGVYGIVWTQAVADAFSLIVAMTVYHKTYKKLVAE